MKRFLSALCLLTLTTTATAETAFPYHHRQATIPNGLRVLLIPMLSNGLVTYWSVVRTGSRDEVEPGRSGFAHFFEHMMFRGTKTYPGPVYDRIVTSIGADSNAFTSEDLTAFHLTFAKEDLPKVVEIESDRFQNLQYGREAFQTEAGAVYGEYRKDQTQPTFLLDERLRDTAFDRHTYKHTTMGFEADVKSMPQGYEYSMSFFRRFYRPENVVLLVVGDIDPAATIDLIKKHYGPWKPGYTSAKITAESPQSDERKVAVTYPGKTLPILDLAYHGDPFDPENRDYVAARLLGELAFGRTSDVYKRLVLDQQKAESVWANVPINRDAPLFEVAAIVKRVEDLDAVQHELDKTIERFQTEKVDPDKLARVKRHEKYEFFMELDSPAKVAAALVPFISATGGIAAIDRLYAEADRVTPDDVQRAARKYFDRKRRTVAVLKGDRS